MVRRVTRGTTVQTKRAKKTVSHGCLTHTTENGYVASCRCGWEGEVRKTYDEAYEDAGAHEREEA
jgi:hypothetical protein